MIVSKYWRGEYSRDTADDSASDVIFRDYKRESRGQRREKKRSGGKIRAARLFKKTASQPIAPNTLMNTAARVWHGV